MVRVRSSYRLARKSGIVTRPILRNRGRKNSAMRTMASAAVVSQAVTAIVWLNASPFRPIKCSVDRFVSMIDPAITQAERLRPPRK